MIRVKGLTASLINNQNFKIIIKNIIILFPLRSLYGLDL